MKSLLPNLLTLSRLLLAPVIAWLMWKGAVVPHIAEFGPNARDLSSQAVIDAQALGDTYTWWAAGLFVFAALTDLFDGIAARALDADSKFGRILDPIADKALVGLPLLVLTYLSGFSPTESGETLFSWSNINPLIAIPSFAIIGRDIIITIARLIAEDGEGAPVMLLSKWKTALELVAVALPIFMALPILAAGGAFNLIWLVSLWIAATLSVFTGVFYLASPAAPKEEPDEVTEGST